MKIIQAWKNLPFRWKVADILVDLVVVAIVIIFLMLSKHAGATTSPVVFIHNTKIVKFAKMG